jgi:hypothetical protein
MTLEVRPHQLSPFSAPFWDRTAESISDLGSKPSSIFFGSMLGVGVLSSAWSFGKLFLPSAPTTRLRLKKQEGSILQNRVVAGFTLTGSLARLASWIHLEFFWQAGGALTTGILGGAGFAMGLLRSGSKAFEALDDMNEVERLVQLGERTQIAPEGRLQNMQWINALNYISNIFFTCFCSIEILSIVMVGSFFPPLAGIFLFGSLLMAITGCCLKMGNREEEGALRLLMANDLEKEYTYYA